MRWKRDDGGFRAGIRVRGRMCHISREVLTDRSRGRGKGRGNGKGDGEAYCLGMIDMDSTSSCWPCVPNLVRVRNVGNGIRPHPLGR